MKLENIIINNKEYTILCYFLIVIGIIISYYYIPENFRTKLIILTAILTFSLPVLNIILSKILVKNKNSVLIKINAPQLKIHLEKVVEKKIFNRFIKYIRIYGMIILIFIPILTSTYYYHSISNQSPNQYLILLTTSMFMTLNYTDLVRKQLLDEKPIYSTYAFWGAISLNIILVLPFGSDLINEILNYIYNMQNSLAVLIAIIMLCVGLSALTFSYCSILEKDSTTWKNMKQNGEGYFIASIFSMISILVSFIASRIKEHVNFMPLSNLNIFSYDFIILNIYSVLLIITLSFTIYAIYYMLKSSIYSLKELNVFDEIF